MGSAVSSLLHGRGERAPRWARFPNARTPYLAVNVEEFTRNCDAIMAEVARSGVSWRPHCKAHSSVELVRRQLAAGACGVTCATLDQAEEMVLGGVKSVLIANQLADRESWQRVAQLQGRSDVMVCVDHEDQLNLALDSVTDLSPVVPLLIEVDVGMGRTGIRSTRQALDLAEAIRSTTRLTLVGVMGYEGHCLTLPWEDRIAACDEAIKEQLLPVVSALVGNGHQCSIVSAGGTATYSITSRIQGVTEVQVGGGAIMDKFYAEDCGITLGETSRVVTRVVSVPQQNRFVVDAGFKALSDRLKSPEAAWPARARAIELSAEHGLFEVVEDGVTPRVGDLVEVSIGYSDATLANFGEAILFDSNGGAEVISLGARKYGGLARNGFL